ncbi:MAG: aminotransferase class III-fold pyridoxal phosphate-dependent enzyme [Halobacteriota archaeon]
MDRDTAEPDAGSPPGANARRAVEYHDAYGAKSTHGYPFVLAVYDDAAGPFCRDVDGYTYLDFSGHVASAPLGYNHPVLRERLDEYGVPVPPKTAGQNHYAATDWPPDEARHPGPDQLMERLVEISDGLGFDRVFLSNSGAEAVENAIKICYQHSRAPEAVCFEGAFHGRTLGALSLNRSKKAHRRGYPTIPGVHTAPYCDDRACTPESCGCGFYREGVSALERALGDGGWLDPEDLAYVVVEPIQGEGGYRIPSDAFVDEIERLRREHGFLVVADEVQSGVGRTGEWWAVDHTSLEPDVVAAGKALQVGATVGRGEVFPGDEARISSTWGGGDLVASMVGALTIDVIESEGLLDAAVERGDGLVERLRDVDADGVVDVRGRGLMVAVEHESGERRDAVVEKCWRNGLLTLSCGRRSQRLLPPLDVRPREVELAVDVFSSAVGAA